MASTDGETTPTELANAAREAARAGGRELLAWQGRFEAREKGPRDYVTDADVASQKAVSDVLLARYPDHQFIGEESGANAGVADPGRFCWVVDPLDGTTNYLHGFPSYAVSIAVVRDRVMLAGAIYDPQREEMFWAAAGAGAYLNEDRISTSEDRQISDALVAISLPASVDARSPDLLDFGRVAPHCRAVRRIGSAALNLAYVACGRLDAYWAREIKPWDIAAGVLLVDEAGGRVTDAAGGPFDLWKPPCVACCGSQLHEELLNLLGSPA